MQNEKTVLLQNEKTVLLQNESGTPVLVVVASGAPRPGLPILLRATWRTASLCTFSEDCEPFLFKDEASVRFLFEGKPNMLLSRYR